MAFTNQDFEKGIDFTGVDPATGADLNVLVDNSEPVSDRSINLYSVDTALDTPDVPSPVTEAIPKWKRYLWVRVPYAGASSKTPIVYAWNDDATSDPIYLKWIRIDADVTSLASDVADAVADAQLALDTANGLNSLVTQANNTANEAKAIATEAKTTADGLATTVQEAINTANEAKSDADAANTLAQSALNAANAKGDVNAILNPGTASQLIRTNSSGTGVEWFTVKDQYAKFIHKENSGTDGGASVIGQNIRKFNYEEKAASFATLAASGKFTLAAGTYYIRAISVGWVPDGNEKMQTYLLKDDDSVVAAGPAWRQGNNDGSCVVGEASGVVTISASTVFKVADYHSKATADKGLGWACSLGPATKYEVYGVVEIQKIG